MKCYGLNQKALTNDPFWRFGSSWELIFSCVRVITFKGMTSLTYVYPVLRLTWIICRSYCIELCPNLNKDEVFRDRNYTDCSVIVILTTAEFTHLFIYYCNTVHHVLVAVKGSDSKQKGIWWRVFLELHHISLWVTASSIFKAFLPSEARATNCTSQAGQDGIHRTALPLISPPSAANQTHHIAAFCLLTAAGAKKVNSCSTSVDKKSSGVTGSFCVSLSLSLFLVRFYLQKTGLNRSVRSLSPGSTSAF